MSQPDEDIRGKVTDRSQSQYEIAVEVSPVFYGPLVFDVHPHHHHNHHCYLLNVLTQKLLALGKRQASEDYIQVRTHLESCDQLQHKFIFKKKLSVSIIYRSMGTQAQECYFPGLRSQLTIFGSLSPTPIHSSSSLTNLDFLLFAHWPPSLILKMASSTWSRKMEKWFPRSSRVNSIVLTVSHPRGAEILPFSRLISIPDENFNWPYLGHMIPPGFIIRFRCWTPLTGQPGQNHDQRRKEATLPKEN